MMLTQSEGDTDQNSAGSWGVSGCARRCDWTEKMGVLSWMVRLSVVHSGGVSGISIQGCAVLEQVNEVFDSGTVLLCCFGTAC